MAFRCSTRGQITKLMNVEAMFAICEASDRALNPCAPRNRGESYRTVDAAFENRNCGGDFCKEARKRCEQMLVEPGELAKLIKKQCSLSNFSTHL